MLKRNENTVENLVDLTAAVVVCYCCFFVMELQPTGYVSKRYLRITVFVVTYNIFKLIVPTGRDEYKVLLWDIYFYGVFSVRVNTLQSKRQKKRDQKKK